MIKVLEVSSDTNIGGAGRVLLSFLDEYDRDKFDISVVLPVGSLLKKEVLARNVRVIEINGMKDKSFDIGAIFKLSRLFAEEKPHIVHTHASLSARIAARLTGIPAVIYTRHSLFTPTGFSSKGMGKLINSTINNKTCDSIIAVADAAKEDLLKIGVKEEKISVILNGVPPLKHLSDKEKEELREKFGLKANQKAGAIIGRLSSVKGHDVFIKAIKRVKDAGIDAKFFIVGTGELEEQLKKQVRDLKLDDYIIFTGFLSNISEIVNIIDIEINSSFSEATSLAIIEAMSLGKPVIATNVGGNPGVVFDNVNGFLVPPGDDKAIADKIIELFGNEELLNRLSKGCIELYNSQFTAKAMAEKTEKLYIETLNKKRQ